MVGSDEMAFSAANNRPPLCVTLRFSPGPDRRTYNAPSSNDVAIVYKGFEGAPLPQEYVFYPKPMDRLQNIPGEL